MIIEVAIVAVAVTSIFGSALAFADRVLKRHVQEHPSPIAERRRILERKRATYIKAANDAYSASDAAFRSNYLLEAAEVDRELLRLADEEAAIGELRPWHASDEACAVCGQGSRLLDLKNEGNSIIWSCPTCHGTYRTKTKS